MITAFLSKLRYNYYFSKLLVAVSLPFFNVASLLRKKITRKVKVNGAYVYYDKIGLKFPKDVGVGLASAIFWRGNEGFEPYTWKAIKGVAASSDYFLDIGSNFGFYSVLGMKVNPMLKVIGFEPVPQVYFDNLSFHKANGCVPQTIYNKAVSAKNGNMVLFIPKEVFAGDVRSASLEKDFFYNRKRHLSEHVIETVALDSLIGIYPALVKTNVLMKVDVEGHERSVFEGGRSFIAEVRPIIVCEVDFIYDNLQFLASYFQDLMYRFYGITPTGLIETAPVEFPTLQSGRDFIFLPCEVASFGHFVSWKEYSDFFERLRKRDCIMLN